MADAHIRRPRHAPALVKPYNRLMRPLAGRYLYALLRHRGRRSGKTYETPVVAWRAGGGLLVPISWGPRTDWYRNSVAAGGCAMQIRGRWYACAEPAMVPRAEALSYLPPLMRALARLLPVAQYLLLRRVVAQPGG